MAHSRSFSIMVLKLKFSTHGISFSRGHEPRQLARDKKLFNSLGQQRTCTRNRVSRFSANKEAARTYTTDPLLRGGLTEEFWKLQGPQVPRDTRKIKGEVLRVPPSTISTSQEKGTAGVGLRKSTIYKINFLQSELTEELVDPLPRDEQVMPGQQFQVRITRKRRRS